MGGLAIKTAKTRRYSKAEYDAILPEILEKAKKLFSDATDTKYYFEKDSFGDADILCLVDKPIDINIEQWIYDEFQSKEVVKNSSIYSFEYKELQVDFILTPKHNWETSLIYFSFNDLHNFIGKFAKKFGLKWGFSGLEYDYKIDGKKLGTISVSKDYREVLPFLGFDVVRYDKGFKNLNEIFEYVKSNKYFNPWMFDLEQYNKINRDRDKKRKTYQSFLEYLEHYKNTMIIDNCHYFYPDKKAYLGHIDFHFPGFLRKYRELEKKEERVRLIHSKFNGHILMDEFNISGKELGNLISNFKVSFEDLNSFEEYVLANDIETILNKVKNHL
jgi:hypothetical protein